MSKFYLRVDKTLGPPNDNILDSDFKIVQLSIHLTVFVFSAKFLKGPDRVIGIATRYGLDSPGTESRLGEIVRTSPDRPWSTPGLLYTGHRVSLDGKAAGVGR
jgi:hypothetical protein